MIRKLIAAVAVTASAALVAPGTPLVGTASAEFFLVSREAKASSTKTYTLTEQERANACGNFSGSIIFTDGSSLDCSSGVATLPAA